MPFYMKGPSADDIFDEKLDDGIGASNDIKKHYALPNPGLGKDTVALLHQIMLPWEPHTTDLVGANNFKTARTQKLGPEGPGPRTFSRLTGIAPGRAGEPGPASS